jgi:hypothetical protein
MAAAADGATASMEVDGDDGEEAVEVRKTRLAAQKEEEEEELARENGEESEPGAFEEVRPEPPPSPASLS